MFQDYEHILNAPVTCVALGEQSSLTEVTHLIKASVQDMPVILIGFSMGGMAAFDFIRSYPEQVKGLILLNSNCHADLPGRKTGRDQHLKLALDHGIEHLIRKTYLPVYFSNLDNPNAELVVNMAEKSGINAFKAQLNILANRPDSHDTLKEFPNPVLIIGGENDIPCPPAHQKEMSLLAPKSDLHIINNVGHFAPIEKTEEIAAIINSWLEKNYD